jgi:hypothetical protein
VWSIQRIVVTKLSFLCLTMLFSVGPYPVYRGNHFFLWFSVSFFCLTVFFNGFNLEKEILTPTFFLTTIAIDKVNVNIKEVLMYVCYASCVPVLVQFRLHMVTVPI